MATPQTGTPDHDNGTLDNLRLNGSGRWPSSCSLSSETSRTRLVTILQTRLLRTPWDNTERRRITLERKSCSSTFSIGPPPPSIDSSLQASWRHPSELLHPTATPTACW